MTTLTLRAHEQPVAVATPEPGTAPELPASGPVNAELVTGNDRTLVFAYRDVAELSDSLTVQGPFRALEIAGPLAFSLTGVLAAVLSPLAEREISVFTLSTFETDWILVGANALPDAVATLRRAGHTVVEHFEGEH
ncbi:ACT domain-containing protein [Actinopolyspora sp. H202]|uniref:ACT domain-containing protein n=1 Tax=Actinopolyspora sp. H202 TaxID=1500456 RepID=UPI003EE64FA8